MSYQRDTLFGASSRQTWRASGSTICRGRGGYSRTQVTPPPPPKPFGSEIDSIDADSLLVEEDIPKIENVEYVSSYNWIDGPSPIILVPGTPPAWTPPAIDSELSRDSGDVFRDINAARYPAFPTEPAVRSISAFRPEYNLLAVDIMACGSTMGNLLRFARKLAKPFRFDVDVAGDTVFFIRRENSPTELIQNVKGYGHTFPEAYTTWDEEVRNSCSHQRIIEYDFGGLHFLIRSEADGYLRGPSTNRAKEKDSTSLDEDLSRMAVASAVPSSDRKLVVEMRGREVPQDQIFDIKTRSVNNVFDMEDILPRLWVNQTHKFLLAYHLDGRFEMPQVTDVQAKILNWQKDNSAALARFHAIIKRIIDVVRDSQDQQVEVSWAGEGPLKITKQLGAVRRVLPADLLRAWVD